MNYSRDVTTSIELGLSLGIEISVIRFDSFVNHPTCSKFELSKDTGLKVLEVAIRHTSIRDWKNMCHDLERARK